MQNRNTTRKILIKEAWSNHYSYMPVLLSEIRWKVYQQEVAPSPSTRMTRSYASSFARTVREHFPGVHVHKLAKPKSIALGLVTREALFRLPSHGLIEAFLKSPDACAMVGLIRVGHPSARLRYAYKLQCYLFRHHPTSKTTFSRYFIQTISLPFSKPISLLCRKDPSLEEVEYLAAVHWPIYPLNSGLRHSYETQYSSLRSLDDRLPGAH